jgi:thioredoxin-related protein
MLSRAVCFFLLLSAWTSSIAEPIDLLHYELSDLRTGEAVDLAQFRGYPVLILLFEPDCGYCVRQAREINALLSQCTEIRPVAVGINGNRQHLREHVFSMQPDFPALMANRDLLQDLGEVQATPLMLLSDDKGYYHLHMVGLQEKETLRAVIGELLPDCMLD